MEQIVAVAVVVQAAVAAISGSFIGISHRIDNYRGIGRFRGPSAVRAQTALAQGWGAGDGRRGRGRVVVSISIMSLCRRFSGG